jgi:hypothetical protein
MSITPKQLLEFSQALIQLHEKVTLTAPEPLDTHQQS